MQLHSYAGVVNTSATHDVKCLNNAERLSCTLLVYRLQPKPDNRIAKTQYSSPDEVFILQLNH